MNKQDSGGKVLLGPPACQSGYLASAAGLLFAGLNRCMDGDSDWAYSTGCFCACIGKAKAITAMVL